MINNNNQLEKTSFDDEYIEDKKRIKLITRKFAKDTISDAFAKYYGDIITDDGTEKQYNIVTTIEIGKTYSGYVKNITKNNIELSIPGVKEELVCTENFNDCIQNIQNYILTHNNIIYFTVRKKINSKYIVSILEGYYNIWQDNINKKIDNLEKINVHIESLNNSGYIGYTYIDTITELTGRQYRVNVFIPGSQIVLNVERDFNRWVDTDVEIIPQKFVKYVNATNKQQSDSLIGSRKKVLELEGFNNLYKIYVTHELISRKTGLSDDTVYEGVISGIINSSKKSGVFVELINEKITGLLEIDSSELLDYIPGNIVHVKIKGIDKNENEKKIFVYDKNNRIINANIKLIFELVYENN